MKVQQTTMAGVLLIEPQVHGDHRGFFVESYQYARYAQAGITHQFVQDNHSRSAAPGVLRGLHYQRAPKAQTKLVRVTRGVIFDVVVDLRRESPTFGQWEGFLLSEHNHRQLLIPKGFAHGFCTLTADVDVQYKVDEPYDAAHDAGIAYDDPQLAIDWPIG